MPRKKIVLQTNASWLRTGLGENGRYLMKHLLKTGKYDLVYYCTQTMQHDPNLSRMPCKAYGSIPSDQHLLNQLNQDPGRARDVSYGAHFIDHVIKTERPDIWWESDDLWSTNGYLDRSWFKQINTVFHKTPDSRPILEEAFKQAKATKNYFTWAEFAVKDMRRAGPEYSHVRHIYGMSDITHFAPIPKATKLELRKRFSLDKDAIIFHTTNRNQLRKCFPQTIEAFAAFQRENPGVRSKLHFHTSFSEKGAGWDIPKLAAFHGVKHEDILCTYICKSCGNWHISPYLGEDVNCPYCKAEKSMITPTIGLGVSDEEMRFMHGVFDAGISAFDSGGLERFSISSLLCGLPTAISSYSCGEDFMNLPFVTPIAWTPYYQPGTNFMKATPNMSSLKGFMNSVARMAEGKKQEIGEKSRDWAVKTFSVETIGAQWEDVFDALPPKDWSTITLESKPKNPDFPNPDISSNEEWVKALYNGALLVEPDPEGFKHWLSQLANGIPRAQIHAFFVGRAREDNLKSAPPADFSTILDLDRPNKRALCVLRESIGDAILVTQLFESFHAVNPGFDLYVGTMPQFFEVFAGNPHVHKVIPWIPQFDSEMQMTGSGQKSAYFEIYMNAAIGTQKILDYLKSSNIAVDLHAK